MLAGFRPSPQGFPLSFRNWTAPQYLNTALLDFFRPRLDSYVSPPALIGASRPSHSSKNLQEQVVKTPCTDALQWPLEYARVECGCDYAKSPRQVGFVAKSARNSYDRVSGRGFDEDSPNGYGCLGELSIWIGGAEFG